MDSFEINKILGAVLGTCLVLLAVHIASGAIFTPTPPAKPGYEIEVKAEQPGQTPGGTAAPAEVPIENLLASASIQQGQADAKVCLTCHNFGKGQGDKIGPDLYGVVGRPVASEPGFNYSAALKAKGGTWTFDALNTWLTNPRADVPGTAMTFAGLPSEKQRADVIDYLDSNSDNPVPLPKAAEAAPAGGATPPAGGAANAPASAAANPPPGTDAPAAATAPASGAVNPPPGSNAPAAANAPASAPATPPGGAGLPQTNSPPSGQGATPQQ
jgi:cytochrome c